jgi:transcription elongation factor GreB
VTKLVLKGLGLLAANVDGIINIMSKAFTRESDDLPDLPVVSRSPSPLPPGAKNYLTPGGAQRLREELERLVHVERPAAVSLPDPTDSRRQIQLLDQRIRYLEQSLQTAVIVPPPAVPWDQVRIGATVTVRDEARSVSRYRIVGVDETDIDRDWVSWCSPIARALLNARLGQCVQFRVPAGEQKLEIVEITYE